MPALTYGILFLQVITWVTSNGLNLEIYELFRLRWTVEVTWGVRNGKWTSEKRLGPPICSAKSRLLLFVPIWAGYRCPSRHAKCWPVLETTSLDCIRPHWGAGWELNCELTSSINTHCQWTCIVVLGSQQDWWCRWPPTMLVIPTSVLAAKVLCGELAGPGIGEGHETAVCSTPRLGCQ
jgi:hypothetical protein